MVLSGRSLLGHPKVLWKLPPRFQGFTEVPPRFSKFRGAFESSLGQIRLGLPKGSVEGFAQGPSKVPSRFHPGCTNVSPRSHQGFTMNQYDRRDPDRNVSPGYVISEFSAGRSLLGLQVGNPCECGKPEQS